MNQNRFSTYLSSQKLAKSFLVGAEEKLRKGDERGAIHMLVESVRAFQTSTNCLASLAFEPRKKHQIKRHNRVVAAAKSRAALVAKFNKEDGIPTTNEFDESSDAVTGAGDQ